MKMEEKENKLVFETVSAINGITVELTTYKFNNHIVANHPEMKGHEKDIEEAIKKPTIVYKAKTLPDKRLHFIRKTNKNEISQYNNVIVEYNDNSKTSAHVTTSFYSDEIGKGGGDCVYFNYNNNI